MSLIDARKTHPESQRASTRDLVREICTAVHELSHRVHCVTQVATTDSSAWGAVERTPALSILRLNLATVTESVTRLRWLSKALASAQLELVESRLDLSAVIKECVDRVHPPLPEACDCTCIVTSGLVVHADIVLLAEGLSLLLNAASLRLRAEHMVAGRPELRLRVRQRRGETMLRLAYNAARSASPEADEHQELALRVFGLLGSSVLARGTSRWSVVRIDLPREPVVESTRL